MTKKIHIFILALFFILIVIVKIILGGGIAWGYFKKVIEDMRDILDKDVKPDLKDMRERFIVIEDMVSTL